MSDLLKKILGPAQVPDNGAVPDAVWGEQKKLKPMGVLEGFGGIGTSVAAPSAQGVTINEAFTLPTNYNLGDGMVYIAGKGLFSNAAVAPSKTLKWANPAASMSAYTEITYPNNSPSGSEGLSIGLCYSPSQNRLYQSYQATDNGTNYIVRVNQINPDDMSYSLFTDTTWGLSASTDTPRSPNVCTDDTYLYIAGQQSAGSATDTEIKKYRLSDGTLIGSRTVTGKTNIHPLLYDSVTGKLFFGGSSPSGHAWVGWMTTDMASHDTVEISVTLTSLNDDMVVVGDYVWVQNESVAVSPRQTWRVKKDLSTFDLVPLTGLTSGFPDAMFYDSVHGVLIIGIKDITNGGKIVILDPSALTVSNIFSIGSSVNAINEVILVGSTIFIATYETTSKVARATLVL